MSENRATKRRPARPRNPNPTVAALDVLHRALPVGEWVTPARALTLVGYAGAHVRGDTISTPAGPVQIDALLRAARRNGRMVTRPTGDVGVREHLLLPARR